MFCSICFTFPSSLPAFWAPPSAPPEPLAGLKRAALAPAPAWLSLASPGLRQTGEERRLERAVLGGRSGSAVGW